MNAAPTLADIRARLAALESRAEARRLRDAQLADDAAPTREPAPELHRDNGAAWKAAQGRDWLAEARDDLATVDAAPRTARKLRLSAPEYRDEAEEAPAVEPAPATVVEPAPVASEVKAAEPTPAKVRALPRKLHQAHARGDWRAREARILATALRASLAPSMPIAGPFDGFVARSSAGPP